MNRNIALGLGTIIGILAMLLFLRSNGNTGSFGKSFPLRELQLRKQSKEGNNRFRVNFENQKNFNDQSLVTDKPVPDKCL
jgi:hypothetical protein